MNKKIKIIDLYNLIANEENLPQRIVYKGVIYNWDKLSMCEDKINELVKAVKEIRKNMNKEQCCCCGVEITDENRALHNMCNECKYGIDWEEKSK